MSKYKLSYIYHPSYDECDLCGKENYYNINIWNVHSKKLQKYVLNSESYSLKNRNNCLRICANCAQEVVEKALFNLKYERNDDEFIENLEIFVDVLKMDKDDIDSNKNKIKEQSDIIYSYLKRKIEENVNDLKLKYETIQSLDDEVINELFRIIKFKNNIDTEKLNESENKKMFNSFNNKNHVITNETSNNVRLNEMAVIFQAGYLWKEISKKLNLLHIKEFHSGKYPDMIAVRKINDELTKDVSIEFESTSLNFMYHKHPIDECDIIICWIHNWESCPEHIEVLELCNMKIENNKLTT